ncbi:hypothetical protein CIK05_10135 [Bdellovibrio sp. qaytius]|nr:hypothetical protein CIK05_10135 [Bdellovibrio sp. qaytius]
MKRLFLFLILLSFSGLISSCSIYKSADRNNFETESPTLKIKSLQKIDCSGQSLAAQATESRLIANIEDTFLWEYKINQTPHYESNDLKGTYCLYDVTFE